MPDILIVPKRSTTENPQIFFSGSVQSSASIRMEVLPEGQVSFLGKSGSLFGVTDSLVGSLMSVSDISGLPILEVFSDDKVVMGKFNQNTLVVTGSTVGIGKANPNSATRLDVSGSVFVTGSVNLTQAITGSGAIGLLAGGSNQNVTLTPSGTGVIAMGGTGTRSRFYYDTSNYYDIYGDYAYSAGELKLLSSANNSITLSPNGGVTIGTIAAIPPANGLAIRGGTVSTSTTTGALIVSGGLGLGGSINAGGNLSVSGTGSIGDYSGDADLIIAAKSTGVGYLRWRPTVSATNAYGFSIAYDNPNNKLSFLRHDFSTAGVEWLAVARSTGNATFAGNVGIGKTNPSITLDINGGVFITGSLNISSSTSIDPVAQVPNQLVPEVAFCRGIGSASGPLSVLAFGSSARLGLLRGVHDGSGTVQWRFGNYSGTTFVEGVRFASSTSGLSVGGVEIYHSTPSTSTTTGALIVSGGLGLGEALWVGNGINTLNAKNIAVRNADNSAIAIRMYADSSNYGYIDTTSNTELRLQVGSGTKVAITNTGTVSAVGNVIVSGSLNVTGSLSSDGINGHAIFGGVKRLLIGYDNTTDVAAIASVQTGVMWKPLALQPISGQVLIGKTNANATFDVNGNSIITGSFTVLSNTGVIISRASNPDQTLTLTGGDGAGIASVSARYQLNLNSNDSTYPMTFQIAGSEKMRITSAGNVAIGKTTTNGILDVNGNVVVTGSLKITGSMSIAQDISAESANFRIQNVRSPTPGNIVFTVGSPAQDRMVITGLDGRVGINTNNPSVQLEVKGNTIISSSFFSLNSEVNTYGKYIYINPSIDQHMYLGTLASQGDLRVAIGKRGGADGSANAKLDVNGNTIITGSLTVTNGIQIQGAGSDLIHPFLLMGA